MTETPPILEVKQISKGFPGVRALHKVDLQVHAGEVLAVIGENGAGKSTLMKILAGVQPQDTGEILLDGQAVKIESTRHAMELGIVLIHQELNLADNLDVASNIFLGREPIRRGMIDQARMVTEAKQYLQMVGLDIDPKTIVSTLSIGHQQLIEIAKALSVDAKILIMDEPTSSLSTREAENLFRVVKELKRKGIAVIYISHRLGEVRELADRVSVLRDGLNAGELTRDEITHDNMVTLMVGRDVSQFYARTSHPIGKVVLQAIDLVTPTWPTHRLNFEVRAGEIVGVAGLVGAGRTELLRVLFGIDRPVSGELLIDGKRVDLDRPSQAIQSGLALVPEDRKKHGVILEMTVRQNIGMAGLNRHRRPGGFVNFAQEKVDTQRMIQQMRIRTPSDTQIVQYLSGGNQQKVVIGKWLALGPKILLLDEPTRGIDVGAKEEIYSLMERLAEEGMAILFVSSEMEEILGMSDRVLVMHEGQITGELSRDLLSEEAIMQLATRSVSAA